MKSTFDPMIREKYVTISVPRLDLSLIKWKVRPKTTRGFYL